MKTQANKAGISKRLLFTLSRLKPVRLVLAGVILLALVEVLFLGETAAPAAISTLPGQAASATRIPPVDSLNQYLPNSKEEATNFSRQHASLFNFDEVTRLRYERAVALGQISTGQPDSTGNTTPAPTGLVSNFNGLVTPRPTNSFAPPPGAGLFAYTPPSGTCNSPASTNVTEDQYDTPPRADDTYTGASLISAIADPIPQNHSLTSIGVTDPGQGDIDWVKFQITSAAVSQNAIYTIQTTNLQPSSSVKGGGIDTVIELYRWDTRGPFPTSPIKYNDDYSSVSLNSKIVYQSMKAVAGPPAVAGDDDPNVVFYVKIYGALNSSCTGTYQVSVNYNIPSTPTPVASTIAATVTPDPCRDIYEDDSNSSLAKELRVTYTSTPAYNGGTPGVPDTSSANNNVQTHSICPTGDQDWVYVDLVKGKPYSIFTSNLTGGLDTLMVLFEKDANGNFNPLYSSDDFPGMGLASRIDFVVPARSNTPTGEFVRYYIVVKDVSGHGAPGMNYNLTLSSPGSPKNDCIDYYEPDGLQHLAKEILINEIQSHTLCPNGDADWVKFFAKAGRTYTIRTRFDVVPGMDTSLAVFALSFDPNNPTWVVSQTLIGSNDDVSFSDLSSQVDFTVPADGIYYAQVKNKGDIGRPGFYYQLSFTTGGVNLSPTPTTSVINTPTPTINASNLTATASAKGTANALATATPTLTPTSTSGTTLLPQKFGDPAFQHLWDYSDLAVAQNQAQRSWEWGPKPGVIRQEPYANSPGGVRQVQYFDKSRMEINNPKGDRTSPWFVSNGLLVREMITGQIASGDSQFEQRAPARLQMAGDFSPNNPAPIYAQFAALITNGDQNRTSDLTGQSLKAGLSTAGSVLELAAPPETLKLANYIPETGHNIPQVFYDYMTGQGTIFDNGYREGSLRNWVFSMGYPLSEAYWVKAQVNGVEKDVLVQVFERRVLTYTPSNPVEWRVEMANVGQHYYLWRYHQNLADQ